MNDAIETLCSRYGFNEMIKDDRLAKATAYLLKAYEIFYGKPPSSDVVKDLLKVLIEVSAEWTKFVLDPELRGNNIKEHVLNRVSEKAYAVAMEKIKKWGFLQGI